jgi:hypothetical protein
MFTNAFISRFRLDIFYHIWYNKVKLKIKIKGEEMKLPFLNGLFEGKSNFTDLMVKKNLSKKQLDIIAELLKNNPEQIEVFQNIYEEYEKTDESKNLFQQNAAKTIEAQPKFLEVSKELDEVVNSIVEELLSQSQVWDSEKEGVLKLPQPVQHYQLSDAKELSKLGDIQLTGYLCKVDVDASSSDTLLETYRKYLETGNMHFYHLFRQGLDILDLDYLAYEMLSYDPNSMSKWLPEIAKVAKEKGFFKIPKTKILRVPVTLLQSTRVFEYQSLSPVTIEIINRYIHKVFELDDAKDYFIKTGTFSSKFDFRNAKVTAGQEVKELGSYLWYIQHQASQMASPLNNVCMYGVSSNNEWVVREFIDDVENNPTIYNGLPLHTEYRIFVDFDTNEIIGINPYWDADIMKENFLDVGSSAPSQKHHDYVIYTAHEHILTKRYEDNKEKILSEVEKLLPDCKLQGQWSIDIMQNGNDFWLIDMARASESSLSHCVPQEKLKKAPLPFLKQLEEISDSSENYKIEESK